MYEQQERSIRAKSARAPRWAREASVFVWLVVGALALIGLLFWLF